MMENKIEISRLNKVYSSPDPEWNGLQVLSDVSLSVNAYEFVSLLGPSGCGKSTLLKLIAGLDKAYDGQIMLGGRDPKTERVPVCYMLQKDCLMPWRSILSNILLPIKIKKGDIKKAGEEIRPMIAEFGLSGFENYKPGQLSGGMKQRAALLRTYLMEGDIMLLDEPFGALDEITRMQMQDWLISVWEKHRKTVLFVTHNVDEAIFLSDRVLVMSGRPGTISGDIPIALDRPRSREMALSQKFLDYKKRIMELLSKC
jgi:NitT/TauT family transport system ATP-binding protein